MEFKAPKRKGTQEINLDNEAKLALEQINKSNYIAELKQLGIANIRSIGIAFYKKAMRLAWQ